MEMSLVQTQLPVHSPSSSPQPLRQDRTHLFPAFMLHLEATGLAAPPHTHTSSQDSMGFMRPGPREWAVQHSPTTLPSPEHTPRACHPPTASGSEFPTVLQRAGPPHHAHIWQLAGSSGSSPWPESPLLFQSAPPAAGFTSAGAASLEPPAARLHLPAPGAPDQACAPRPSAGRDSDRLDTAVGSMDKAEEGSAWV